MSTKSQDVLVVLKLVVLAESDWKAADVAAELGLSVTEFGSALKRLAEAQLVSRRAVRAARERPRPKSLEEFLVHGLKYVFPPRRGEVTRGIPTSWAAPPLSGELTGVGELPPVWPSATGSVRGMTLVPLYKSVPFAAERDPALYELLALSDALREGRVRERALAREHLTARLENGYAARG